MHNEVAILGLQIEEAGQVEFKLLLHCTGTEICTPEHGECTAESIDGVLISCSISVLGEDVDL